MDRMPQPWDYLIVTASNDAQAAPTNPSFACAARWACCRRRGEVLVVADPEGSRMGSGGSTLLLLVAPAHRLPANPAPAAHPDHSRRRRFAAAAGLRALRQDLRARCRGKATAPSGATLFDRLAANLLDLPAAAGEPGRSWSTSGDALLFSIPARCLSPARA